MGRIGKILIVLCCALLFAGLAEAKTYVNDGFGFSMWLPDETEIVYDGIADGEKSWSMRAEYKGLNIWFLGGHTANRHGRDFSTPDDVNEYIDLERRSGEFYGNSVTGYCKNPVKNHYYAIVIQDNRDKEYMCGSLATTMHRNMMVLSVSGNRKYMEIIQKILDSFKCDKD
ncbi:MAG: hypothetical protein MJ048_00470 [Acidaminococcaceae bacterium]|nr:hypothetical protein [Acidaminococcaceae bacterium]